MTLAELSTLRLISQQIEETKFKTAKEIVGWMGAMQAQDYSMAKWAVGIRLLDSTVNKIEKAYDKGEIIRTHLMRPTWHFVSAGDIYWMLKLTAPQIKSASKSRDKELELTEAIFVKSNNIIEKALSKSKCLTREELKKEFDAAKIKTDNNRLSHLLLRAELDEIVCSGPIKDNKQTYALLSERVPYKRVLTHDESLAELATRYFTSHCPATLKDFVWWTGLPVKKAIKALEFIKSNFISETIHYEKYWLTNSFSVTRYDKASVYLMPAYDEYIISYKDRSASLLFTDSKKAISNNGIFRPIIVVDGQVKGVWKRTINKDKVIIETNLFQPLSRSAKTLIKENAHRFGKFLKKELEIITK
jgi:hypothetical protein